MIYDFDWNSADKEFAKAQDCPLGAVTHSIMSQRHLMHGLFDEALHHARLAAELDFKSPIRVVMEPWILLFAGRTEEAVARGKELIEQFGHRVPQRTVLGDAYAAAGDLRKALDEYEEALEIERFPAAISLRGYILGRMGKRSQALASLKELHRRKEAGTLAYVSSLLSWIILYNAALYPG